jgi:hypothetical protein
MRRIELREKSMKQLVFAGLVSMITATVQAGQVDVPHSFQGGSPALAAEVNANFDALEVAVDDNAVRIETLESDMEAADMGREDNTLGISNNANNIAALQANLLGAGMQVRVADTVVGRFLARGTPPIEVEIAGSGGTETELAAQRTAVGTTNVLVAVSATGYILSLSTTDFQALPFGGEGTLMALPRWYDSGDCTGQAYFAVEGPVGLFSTYQPGTGDSLSVKRWYARQGFAFRTVDPSVPGEAYMVRRGQTVQQVALNSIFIWSNFSSAPLCLDLSVVPGHTGNETNSAVLVEVLDPVETGIAADIAGEITVGL